MNKNKDPFSKNPIQKKAFNFDNFLDGFTAVISFGEFFTYKNHSGYFKNRPLKTADETILENDEILARDFEQATAGK